MHIQLNGRKSVYVCFSTCYRRESSQKLYIVFFFFPGFDVLKYVSLAERKWPPSPAKNPADKLACQPVTFLNQVPDLWDENGVEILPPSPEPDTRKPALG